MDAQRIHVKVYCDESAPLVTDDCVRVFHKWVRDRALEEVLIDVADYRHVDRGPGVLLVCHHANYSADSSDGRLGVSYSRKREVPGTFEERIATAIKSTLNACRLLEQDAMFKARPRFTGRELSFRINDRLLAPNVAETYAAVEPALETVLKRLFGDVPFELTRSAKPEELLELHVSAKADVPGVAELYGRL